MKTNVPISEEEILLNVKHRLDTLTQLMEELMLVFGKIKMDELNEDED